MNHGIFHNIKGDAVNSFPSINSAYYLFARIEKNVTTCDKPINHKNVTNKSCLSLRAWNDSLSLCIAQRKHCVYGSFLWCHCTGVFATYGSVWEVLLACTQKSSASTNIWLTWMCLFCLISNSLAYRNPNGEILELWKNKHRTLFCCVITVLQWNVI